MGKQAPVCQESFPRGPENSPMAGCVIYIVYPSGSSCYIQNTWKLGIRGLSALDKPDCMQVNPMARNAMIMCLLTFLAQSLGMVNP